MPLVDSPGRSLKIGLILPDTQREMGGPTTRWPVIADMARLAEESGFDSVWVPDHLMFRQSDGSVYGPWECWSVLSAVAAVTRSVEIGPLVSCMGFRNPALLAKMASTVDEISCGRLILAIGSGWHDEEFLAFGFPLGHRVARFEEGIAVIHRLLQGETLDFAGEYFSLHGGELRPKGLRPGRIPIMVGSSSPRMLAALAQFGDIWNEWGLHTVAEVEAHRAMVDQALLQAGRRPDTVLRSVGIVVDLPIANRTYTGALAGLQVLKPGQLIQTLFELSGAGIDHVQLLINPNNVAGIRWVARELWGA